MRFLLGLVGIAALLFLGAWALGLVTLNQTQVARAPEVKLEGGQAPGFAVNVATVEVGTENETVAVPTVRTENRTVAVPTVRINKPAEAKDDHPRN